MNKIIYLTRLTVFLPLLISGCIYEPIERDQYGSIEGYRPVYGEQDVSEIKMLPARQVNNPGKIYLYHHYLLVNELGSGIHVFDNSDPSNPETVGFIQMLGNTDMAIKDGILYGDHMGQLVGLTLNNFTTLQEQARLPLENWLLGVMPPSGFYFECIDPEKGLVVSWKKSTIENQNCYAF